MENILSNIIACLSVAGFAIGGYYLCKGLAPVDEKEWKNETHQPDFKNFDKELKKIIFRTIFKII